MATGRGAASWTEVALIYLPASSTSAYPARVRSTPASESVPTTPQRRPTPKEALRAAQAHQRALRARLTEAAVPRA